MAVNVSGGALEFEAIINNKGFQQQIDQIQNQLKGLTRSAEGEAKAIDNLAKKATGLLGAYASGAFIQGFVRDIVRVRGEFQQLEVAFETMLGSKAKSDKLMAEITEFAATTPFELEDVAKATKQLLAFGISADKIKGTLRSLGDVSAGIGAPLGEIAYLFGTIKTQGVALTQDVRQFAQRGIPIYEELSKVLKVSTEEVGNLITAGKVGFPEIEKVFTNLTAEGSKFGGLMEKQSHTLTGQLSNLSDAWSRMLNEIGQSNEGVFSDIIAGANTLVDNYKSVVDILAVLAATYGTYKAAVIATTVVQAIQERMALQAALSTTALTTAQKLQSVGVLTLQKVYKGLEAGMAFLASPAALISGLAAIGAGLYMLRQKIEIVKTSQELLSDAAKDASETFSKQEVEIKNYVGILENQNVAESVRLDAYNKLKSIAPEIIGQLSFQAAKTADLTDATNTYVAALKQRILFESKQSKYAEALKQQQDKFDAVKNLEKDGNTQTGNNIAQTGFFGALGNAISSNLNGSLLQGGLSKYETATAEYRMATQTVIDIEQDLQIGMGNTKDAIQLQIQSLESQNKLLNKTGLAYKQNEDKINSLKKSLESLGKTSNVTPTNKLLIDNAASLDALKSVRSKIEEAYSAETDKARKAQLAADLKYADERKKILDPYGSYKSGQKQQKKDEEELNKLLDQRKSLIQTITDLQRGSKQSGLIKEQSEIDKINEKYDVAISKVADYNKKVQETGKGQKIGQIDINALNDARSNELRNAGFKQDTQRFKDSLEAQKQLFTQYEEAKKQIGVENASELFKEQTKGFQSYLSFLQAEAAKISPKIALGIANIGDIENFKKIVKEIQDTTKKAGEDELNNIVQLLADTRTYGEERQGILDKYAKKEQDLEKARLLTTKKGQQQLIQDLKKSKEQELKVLDDAVKDSNVKQTLTIETKLSKEDVTKQLNELSQQVAATNLTAEGNIVIPEGTAKQVQEAIDKFNSLKNVLDTVSDAPAENLKAIADDANNTAISIQNAADAIRPFNQGLADALEKMGKLSRVQTLQAFDDRRKQIDTNYQDKVAAQEKQITAIVSGEYKKRFDKLKELKEQELQAVKDAKVVVPVSAELSNLSSTDIKKQLSDLVGQVSGTKVTLPSDVFKDIQDGLSSLGDLKSSLVDILDVPIQDLGQIAKKGEDVRQKFEQMAIAVEPFNKELADSLRKIGALAGADVSISLDDRSKDIENRYAKAFQDLEANKTKFTAEQIKERKDTLNQEKEEELRALDASRIRQGEVYKKMGEDLITFTREDLKTRLNELKKILADGFVIGKDGKKTLLTPEMISELQGAVDRIQGLLNSTNKIAVSAGKTAKVFGDVRNSLAAASKLAESFNQDLADILNVMTSMADAGVDIAASVGQFASGDVVGGIASAVSGVSKLIGGLFGESPAEKKRKEDLQNLTTSILTGEFQINELYRERAREQVRINKLRLEGIKAESDLLKQQQGQIQTDFNTVLKELQGQTAQIIGKQLVFGTSKENNDKFFQGLLDAGKTIDEIRNAFQNMPDAIVDVKLTGLSFDQLEQLFIKGQLQGKAKELFETLQKLKAEGVDVDKALADAKKEAQELFTGTTSDSIADSLISGFEKGLTSAQDFAGTFEDLMKKAILNSLKFKYLEAPLQKFFDEFAAASESNGELSKDEVTKLNSQFDSIINAANAQFQQLQQLSGLNFMNDNAQNTNSLQGAIKNIQEETAQLLAGRLAGIQLSSVDILNVAMQQLERLNAIQFNTANTVARIERMENTLIDFYQNKGIKIA